MFLRETGDQLYIVHVQYTMKSPPIVRIDASSQVPAYAQIVAEIRALLVLGELPAGAPLPTVRQLAVDLNVHHNTVAQAYRILAREGWLDLRRGRGARVVARPKPPRSRGESQRSFHLQLKRLLAKAIAEGVSPKAIARNLVLHARSVTRSHAKGAV